MHATLTDANLRQSIIKSFSSGCGMLVRKASGREVYRLDLSAQNSFYVKAFALYGNFFQNTVVLFKVWHEYYHHIRLLEKKVPLPEVIGWARVPMNSGNEVVMLVTREVSQSQPLQKLQDVWVDCGLMTRFFTFLAGFLAQNYRKGIFHKDLHLGNILWDKQHGRLVFVDPKEISVSRRISVRKILSNLSMLYCSFYPKEKFDESVWDLFLKIFYEQYGLTLPYDSYLKIMKKFKRKRFSQWIRRRTKRCFRDNVDFAKLSDANSSGMVIKSSPSYEKIKNDFNCFLDEKFGSEQSVYLKNSNTTAVLKTQDSEGKMVIKKFNVKRRFDPVKNFFRRSRAYRSWYWGWRLTLNKIPTPQPVFYSETRRMGLLYESFYAMEYAENIQTATDFLNDWGNTLTVAERRTFLRRLAFLCGSLIDSGIHHHDFQLKNLLVERIAGYQGQSDFILSVIDIEAVGRQFMTKNALVWNYIMQLRKSYLRLSCGYVFTTAEILLFLRKLLKEQFDRNKVKKFLKTQEVI